MSRGNKAPFKLYEGRKQTDKHVRLTRDMITSAIYMSLAYSSRSLYNYMKLWACGELEFDYSWKLASKHIKSSRTYDTAKKELIKKGFIECIRTSKCSRYPNRYKFISEWHYK